MSLRFNQMADMVNAGRACASHYAHHYSYCPCSPKLEAPRKETYTPEQAKADLGKCLCGLAEKVVQSYGAIP